MIFEIFRLHYFSSNCISLKLSTKLPKADTNVLLLQNPYKTHFVQTIYKTYVLKQMDSMIQTNRSEHVPKSNDEASCSTVAIYT